MATLVLLDLDGARADSAPGLVNALERLREQGRHVGLVTARDSLATRGLLAREGLTALFDLIVTADSAPAAKPDPAVLRHAMACFHVEPEDTLYVGTRTEDVRMARRAGVQVWAYGADADEDAAPDRRIDHLHELAALPRRIPIA